MKHEIIENALNEISDVHIAEAAGPRRKKHAYWITPVAAVLAAAILISALFTPRNVRATGLIAAPVYPEMVSYPQSLNSQKAIEAWRISKNKQHDQPKGYASGTETYFSQIIPAILSQAETDNTACSPLNIYIALAMLAEITDGRSQSQILDLIGQDNLNDLRTQAGHVWNAHYCDDNATTSILANSLWLDSKYSYDSTTVSNLASHYYASVFRGDLASQEMSHSLQAWLDTQTDGLLKEQTRKNWFDSETALALASTVLYRSKWRDNFKFLEKNNTQSTFHGPAGDITCTFMNNRLTCTDFIQGTDFSATCLDLDDRNRMWLILPNKEQTTLSVLESGEAVSAILGTTEKSPLSVRVDLSIPKFDIAAEIDLTDTMKSLGITDVFNPDLADFSAVLPDQAASLYSADHAVRVAIDEEGVAAAAYTVLQVDSNSIAEEIIPFTLDRPFLFFIISPDNLPLFAGVVNQP